MKNDGKIGKEYVREEIREKQFPNLRIILPSLSGLAASCYLNLCAPARYEPPWSPVFAGNQSIYYGVPVIDLPLDKMPSLFRHSTVGPLWTLCVSTVVTFKLQFLFYMLRLFK